jgi:hypothetical protein
MKKFKEQLTHPYKSDNFFMDLNIENLIMMYEKCNRELKDALKCFNITDEESQSLVMTNVSKKQKKHELRINFEEICFVSKVEYD